MRAPIDSDSAPRYGHIALQPRKSDYVPDRLLGSADFTVFADGAIKYDGLRLTARTLATEIAAHLESECVAIADGAYVSVTSPREAVEHALEYVSETYDTLFADAAIDSEEVISLYLEGTGTSYRDWPSRPPSMTTVRGRFRIAIPIAAVLFDSFRTYVGLAQTRQHATAQPSQHR